MFGMKKLAKSMESMKDNLFGKKKEEEKQTENNSEQTQEEENGERTLPSFPSSFKANVKMKVFGMSTPTVVYYDYPNGRQRIEWVSVGEKNVDIELWGNTLKKFHWIENPEPADGEISDLSGEMTNFFLIPGSKFKGITEKEGKECEHWEYKFFGVEIDWYLTRAEKEFELVLYKCDPPLLPKMSLTFETMEPMDFDEDSDLFKPPPCCPGFEPPVYWPVSGFALNAVNGRPIVGAEVTLGSMETTTDEHGVYKFAEVQDGVYPLAVKHSDFFSVNRSLPVHKLIARGTTGDFALSPKLQSGEYRAILTWGKMPLDLDIHGVVEGQSECYYRNRNVSGYMILDRDCVGSYGPETLTLSPAAVEKGVKIHVLQYSSPGLLTTSNASVHLYNESGLVKEYSVPTEFPGGEKHMRWDVCAITAAGVEDLNCYHAQ
eukprot:GCRY01000645.1.p1 GENE.GCRY01000645.1~~GCRY01000645.1.p1  ORF type:complete len:432 (+),score=104.38 GCRY01000645.1:162-1457(+)